MPQPIILIVDDNPVNLSMLGELLRGSYRVCAATSGARALKLARMEPQPDLMLLDLMMPEMSGHEVLERLRAAPETRDLPVILTTAMDTAEDEQRGLVLGAVDHISKPLRPAIVLARVNTQIEFKRAREPVRNSGSSREEALGQRRGTLQPERTPAHLKAQKLATLARGETRSGEFGNRRKDVARHDELVHATPTRQAGGRITHHAAIGEAITERKRIGAELDAHRHRLQDLVDQRTRQRQELDLALLDRERFIHTLADHQPGLLSDRDRTLRCRHADRSYREWSRPSSTVNCCTGCRAARWPRDAPRRPRRR